MPTRTCYVTASGQPPNRGIPPGVAFQGRQPTDPVPPPPPVGSAPQPQTFACPPPSLVATYAPPPPPPTPTPAPNTPFEPPGARLNGETFVHEGKAYLFPAEHTLIHFFHDGHRPFEDPSACGSAPPFMAVLAPSTTTAADLMRQLGVPQDGDEAGDRFGVTECVEVGDGSWIKGKTFVVSQDRSKKTLKELKWEGEKPVWLASFDAEKHYA